MAGASRTVRVKFDGDVKGLAIAAKQGEQIVDRFAENSARTFTSRFRTWFTGRGADDANTVGRFFARTFGTGLLSGFSVPTLGPIFLGALLAVVAVVAPVVGAALAAGVVSAFGAGLVGLGIVFAAQSQQVKTAFSALAEGVAADLKLISKPFEATLVQIAGFMRRTFDSFRPILSTAFADLAPIVSTFADQFFSALEKFKPAVAAISDAFGALLTALGPKLGPLFADISDTIEGISETISNNAETFASLITFFINLVDVMLETVGVLAQVYANLALTFDIWSQAIVPFNAAMDSGAEKGTKFAGSIDKGTQSLRDGIQALTDYAAAQQAATDPVFALIQAVTGADEAQSAYNEAVRQFGVDSPQAAAAAVGAAQAVAALEQAALNGDISFGGFDRKLREWVATGQITAAQADTIRSKVAGARGEAEAFQGTYEATVAVKDRATSALAGIRAWLDRIQSKTVTITARTQIPAGVSVRQLMERQHGGPVMPHRSYLVGERGPEVLTMGGQAGNITPNHQISAAGGGGRIRLHPSDIAALGEAMGRVVLAGIGTAQHNTARISGLYARAG